jgi:dihydroorotate dehydrogenase electron transfer subunit
MITEKAKILSNSNLKGDYFKVVFHTPLIVKEGVKPGHFAHVLITGLRDRILRRPFSIFNVEKNGQLEIVYKIVGEGTKFLSELKEGVVCDILGPLGNPYSYPEDNEIPVVVAGGYGSAAMYLIAKNSKQKGVLLIGARNSEDLILMDEYEKLGYEVKVTTDDGSLGHKGFVTELLGEYCKYKKYKIYGCGPNPMMYAMANLLQMNNFEGEVSLDHAMCCGIGGCYTCVVKVKDENNGWKYLRTCKEGPVFKSSEIYIEN